MNTIAIDTHKTIEMLKKRGYSQSQAEGFVEAIVESELVTRSYFDSRLSELELRLSNKLYLGLLVHGAAVVAAIATFSNLM